MDSENRRGMFGRCKALTQEDKDRNLESEELEYCGEDFDGEEIKEEQGTLDHISTCNFANPLFREQFPYALAERSA